MYAEISALIGLMAKKLVECSYKDPSRRCNSDRCGRLFRCDLRGLEKTLAVPSMGNMEISTQLGKGRTKNCCVFMI